MKRMLAALLALTLLWTAALAESPSRMNVLRLDGIEIDGARLNGLEARLAAGVQDGAATLHIDVSGNGAPLLDATAQYAGGRLLIGGGSLARSYALSLTALNISAQFIETIDMLVAALSGLGEVTLPAYEGAALPMARFGELARGALGGTAGADGTVTARIPSASLMALAEALLQTAGGYGLPVDQVAPMLDELKRSGSGVDIVFTARDDAQESRMEIGFIPVSGNVAADAPIARVTLLSRENFASALVYAAPEGIEARQGGVVIESDPEGRELSIHAGFGLVSFQSYLYPRDGLQVISARLDNQGGGMGFELCYGNRDGADLLELKLDAPGAVDMSFSSRTAMDAAGERSGELALRVTGLADCRAHARFTAAEAVTAPVDGADAIDLAGYGAGDQLSAELGQAVQGLLAWIERAAAA